MCTLLFRFRFIEFPDSHAVCDTVSTVVRLQEPECFSDVFLVRENRNTRGTTKDVVSVRLHDKASRTMLHCAAASGNSALVRYLLSLWPESEHLQTVCQRDTKDGQTVLHCAASSGDGESIKTILNIYPDDAERLRAVGELDICGRTTLHHAASSGNPDSIKAILSSLPESQHLDVSQFVCLQDIMNMLP